MKRKIEDKTYPGHLTDSHAQVYDKYCKIPIISPGVYFWSKGLFTKFFLRVFIFGGGGGDTWMDICILKMLFIVFTIVIF